MKIEVWNRGRIWGVVVIALSALLAAHAADAGVCFTSGKVYVQQKVYDKACWQLECARKEDPDNAQVYALLGIARYERKQYASAGAVFQAGLDVAAKKKDKKRQDEMTSNRASMTARLFNMGIAALNRAGRIA